MSDNEQEIPAENDKEENQNQSPVPTNQKPEPGEPINIGVFPNCGSCNKPLEKIQWLDYESVRVVFHSQGRCTIGVMPVPKTPGRKKKDA